MRNILLFFLIINYGLVFSQTANQEIDKLLDAGNTLMEGDELIAALDTYTVLFQQCASRKNSECVMSVSEKIGDVYTRLNNFDKALKYYLESLKIAVEKKNIQKQIQINLNIGNTYFAMQLREEGLKQMNNALDIFHKNTPTDSITLGKILIDQSKIYGSLGEYELAFEGYEKAIPLVTEQKNNKSLAVIYNNLGVDLKEQGKYSEALINFEKAKKYWKELKHEYNLAVCDLNIALVLTLQKELDSSEYYTQQALSEFERLKRPYFIKDCYENLYQIAEKQGAVGKSLDYLKLHVQYKDSVLNTNKIRKSLEQQNNYQIGLIEEKNELKIQVNNQQHQSKVQFWTFISVLLGLALITLFLISRRIQQKKQLAEINLKNSELEQQLLSQEVNLKNNKLSQLSAHILNKNEMLNELKAYVKELKQEHDIDITPFLNKINQRLGIETKRKEFELFIDEKHTEFFFKIKRKFPDLTEKELKLCSLLLLELSSKEIATLLNISSGSVDMSRYRLRKKLNIPPDKSISVFLTEI